MSDVQFNRENPFSRVFAADQERQDQELSRQAARDASAQSIEASRQNMAAQRQSMQVQQENQAEARRQRELEQATQRAAGQAAIQEAAPITRVMARPQAGPTQPIPGQTGIESMPASLPDVQETQVIRPAARNREAITTMANAGAGKAALDMAQKQRARSDAVDDKFFQRLGAAKSPADVDALAAWYKANGGTLPDAILADKQAMTKLQQVSEIASKFKLPRGKVTELMRQALTEGGMGSLADAIPEDGEEEFEPHGQPYAVEGDKLEILDKKGGRHELGVKAAAKTGKPATETATIRNQKYRAEVMKNAGINPVLADLMSVTPGILITPAMVAQQTRFLINASRDPYGRKPPMSQEEATAKANAMLQGVQAKLFPANSGGPSSPAADSTPTPADRVAPGQVRAGDRIRIFEEELAAERAREPRGNTPEEKAADEARKQANIASLSRELAQMGAPVTPPPGVPAAAAPPAAQMPPARALANLKPGVITKFTNGQKWTIKNGQPARVE